MGYIVPTVTLEGIIKQLEANNKHLAAHIQLPSVKKLIADNVKQIAIIKDAAPIGLDLYAVEPKKKKK